MKIRFPSVFFADDDPDDREFFLAGMRRIYPQVISTPFTDGIDLMEGLSRCPAADLPSCLIFDYRMPTLSGPQLLAVTGAGTRYASIPKIVWSTSARQKDIEECLGLGATQYVIKPATEVELDVFLRSMDVVIVGTSPATKFIYIEQQ
jgi:CheY-like chemotaxis protein